MLDTDEPFLVHNRPLLWERGKDKGAPSHCPPDSVPLAPRQGRTPALPFPISSGGFTLLGRDQSTLQSIFVGEDDTEVGEVLVQAM